MLPAGATVSQQAAKDLKKSGQPVVQPGDLGDAKQDLPERPLLVQDEPEEDAPHEEQAGEEQPDTASVGAEGAQLRPLGAADQVSSADLSQSPRQPTHGLSEDATRTSVDISQYVGSDQSIFRPIVREDDMKSGSTEDLLKQQARRKREAGEGGPQWTENERLVRCLVVGLAAGLVFALAQFFITGETVNTLYMSIPLGRSDNLVTALTYGIASGVILGFGLGALLVRFQKGSGLGLLLGVLVGWSLGNSFWGILPGLIAGIINGRTATLGVRRVINV
jgi:hypothetical protein